MMENYLPLALSIAVNAQNDCTRTIETIVVESHPPSVMQIVVTILVVLAICIGIEVLRHVLSKD